jgi:hypothetical protein
MTDIYGFNDWMAVEVEDTEGTAVKGTLYLDLMSSNFGEKVDTLFRRSMRQDGRLVKRIIPRNASIDGDVNFEIPASGASKIMYAAFGAPTSSGTASPYTHVFLNPVSGTGHKSLTVVQAIGGYHRISAGAVIGKMSIKAAIDSPLTMTVTLDAIDTAYQDTASIATTWLSSAAYDGGGNYEDFHVGMYLDGTATDAIDDVTIDIDSGLKPKRTLVGSRRPVGHTYGVSDTEIKATMYFSSDRERWELLGQPTQPAYPYKVAATAQPQRTMKLEAINGIYRFTVDLPDIRIVESGDVEYLEDVIKVPVTFRAMYDATTASDVKITVINGTQAIAAGTAVSGANLPTDFGISTASSRKI